jgi:hypothetical protein
MIFELPYDRERAVEYARRWALSRNPLFFDFTGGGGDCTSFISQCVFAGCSVMNYTKTYGWYYISADDRAPAWSGVEQFFDFITEKPEFKDANGGVGPFGNLLTDGRGIDIGDVTQLANAQGDFYHTLIISGFTPNDILVCAHSDDALDRPISSYNFASARVIHIQAARLNFDTTTPFQNILTATSLPR